jgi:hypothetical protein
MNDSPKAPAGQTLRYVFAAVVGLVVALIIVLNLHILAGLEQGYAASPSEVVDHSVILAIVDVVLLVGGPLAGIAVMAARTRR